MQFRKSVWKYPFNFNNFNIFKENIKIFDRNITLTTKHLDKTLRCYKGNIVGKLYVTKQHLGYKLGSFFITKVLGERVAYRKRQKQLLKKQKNKKNIKNK